MFKHGEYYADFDTVSMKPIGELESVSGRKMYVECFFDSVGKVSRLLIHTHEIVKQVQEYKLRGDFLYNERIIEEPGDIDKYINYLGFGREIKYVYHREKETDSFEFRGIDVVDFVNLTKSTYHYAPTDEGKFLPYGSMRDFEAFSPNFGYTETYALSENCLKRYTRFINNSNTESQIKCYEYREKSMFWIYFYPVYIFHPIDCDSIKK